ncbi:hypothetical protein [Rhizobium sp. SL42]|uniref:hypothetical protein n=1 Tax=Rhizobium sp. SL42 TaxID=2806346 RepID=UPI001F425C90|nr:hypothetical protein [Rhizobium sp. SL42]UJW73494.1 hypothetical protein IM739_11245 [Rhizobium sp. SL42]
MVSSISSANQTITQIFLKVQKETQQASESESGSNDGYYSSSLANLMRTYGQDEDSTDDTYSTGLLQALNATESEDDGLSALTKTSDDIQTATFMDNLKAKLTELSQSGDGALKAKEMLAALDAGTLTVTDAEKGKQTTAWDSSTVDGDKTATDVTARDWSSFLRSELKRESTGGYELTESGAHVDKTTGNSASFVLVEDTYVYLTWTAAS